MRRVTLSGPSRPRRPPVERTLASPRAGVVATIVVGALVVLLTLTAGVDAPAQAVSA